MRVLVRLVAVVCFLHESASAQLRPHKAEPATAPPDAQTVAPQSAADAEAAAEVERYFRDRLTRVRPGARVIIRAVHATPTTGVVATELRNDWLTYVVRVRSPRLAAQSDAAPLLGSEAVDAAAETFARLEPVSRERIESVLAGFDLKLADIYKAPTAPYYTNGRGLHYSKQERRFLLVARGKRSAATNECFKAAIDVSTGDVLSYVTTACTIE